MRRRQPLSPGGGSLKGRPRWRPWLLMLSAVAGLVAGAFGFTTLPALTSALFPNFASQSFSNTNQYSTQYAELVTYLETTGQAGRVVQVDLASHPKISQYTDINSSRSGYGLNACGLVAAAAAVGGEDWTPLVGAIARAAGKNYGIYTGIQPSKYVTALGTVFGPENVRAINEGSLGDVYQELAAGRVVIVDIKVNANTRRPSVTRPNYAHFARVLGLDVDKQEIYIENTLRGGPYWTVSLSDFVNVWQTPETSASIILDPKHAENVTRWVVVLDGDLVRAKETAALPHLLPF